MILVIAAILMFIFSCYIDSPPLMLVAIVVLVLREIYSDE